MNKKIWAKIIIPVIALGVLLAPVSPILQIKKVWAADFSDLWEPPIIETEGQTSINNTKILLNVRSKATNLDDQKLTDAWDYLESDGGTTEKGIYILPFKGTIDSTITDLWDNSNGNYNNSPLFPATANLGSSDSQINKFLNFLFTQSARNNVMKDNNGEIKKFSLKDLGLIKNPTDKTNVTWEGNYDFSKLGLNKGDSITLLPVLVEGKCWSGISGNYNASSGTCDYFKFGNTLQITFTEATAVSANNTTTIVNASNNSSGFDVNCSLVRFSLSACIASFTYTIWQVSAKIMELAGKLLDFFIYYSINSAAYKSIFVEEGWGLLRDVANIFFIIALLYIAIKTILGLNVSNNKKLIGIIIIIALLINFSLFFTQVIIDGSNILAKVFYNEIASVKKDPVTGKHVPAEPGVGGSKSISVPIVSGFNPQGIVSDQATFNAIGGNVGYIFLCLILISLTLYAAYMFFVVSILFVGRIVALWISMIFAPLAFVSYTVPFDIPGFGHKKWWKDLLESAFLAPIFIFFLYIIILFINLGKEAAIISISTNNNDAVLRIMGAVIPFAIIFLLLTRAKKIAVDLSGELGKELSKIGGVAVGGAAGIALGAAAMVGRGTIGRASSALKSSETLKAASQQKGLTGWLARQTLKGSNKASKVSFDARGSSAFSSLAGKAGLNLTSGSKFVGMGPKQGGHDAVLQKKIDNKMKEADLYKTKLTDREVNDGDYKDKEGNKITTASALDNHRMEQFKERLGKDDLISSVSYSVADKAVKNIDTNKIKADTAADAKTEFETQRGGNKDAAYKNAWQKESEKYGTDYTAMDAAKPAFEKTFKENYDKEQEKFVNEKTDTALKDAVKNRSERVQEGADKGALSAKVVIGAVALGAGGALGGLGITGIGAGVAGGKISDKLMKEKAVGRTIEKQTQGFKKLGDRLDELNKTLTDAKTLRETRQNEGFGGVFDGSGKDATLNKDRLSKLYAEKETDKENLAQQLRKLNETEERQLTVQQRSDKKKIMEDLTTRNLELQKLSELKTNEDKIFNVQQQIYNTKGVSVNTNAPSSAPRATPPSPPPASK